MLSVHFSIASRQHYANSHTDFARRHDEWQGTPSSCFCPPRRRRHHHCNRLYHLATSMIACCPVGPSGTHDRIDPPPLQEEQTPPSYVPCMDDERSIVVVDTIVGQGITSSLHRQHCRARQCIPSPPPPFSGLTRRGPRQDHPS
jgi:hypothetical protein